MLNRLKSKRFWHPFIKRCSLWRSDKQFCTHWSRFFLYKSKFRNKTWTREPEPAPWNSLLIFMTPEAKPSPQPGQCTMEPKPLPSSQVSRQTANSLASHWLPASMALPGWTEAAITRAWCLEALLEKQPYQASCHLQEGQTPTCEHPAVGVPEELLFQPGLQTSGPMATGTPISAQNRVQPTSAPTAELIRATLWVSWRSSTVRSPRCPARATGHNTQVPGGCCVAAMPDLKLWSLIPWDLFLSASENAHEGTSNIQRVKQSKGVERVTTWYAAHIWGLSCRGYNLKGSPLSLGRQGDVDPGAATWTKLHELLLLISLISSLGLTTDLLVSPWNMMWQKGSHLLAWWWAYNKPQINARFLLQCF